VKTGYGKKTSSRELRKQRKKKSGGHMALGPSKTRPDLNVAGNKKKNKKIKRWQ
jgi:hypothetical protein